MKNKPETYIDNKLKPPKKFFDWCYQQIPTYRWQNKKRIIEASDRTDCEIICKRLTKRSRLDIPERFYPFAIILVTKKRIEIQSYGFWARVENGKQYIDYRLTNFEQFSNGKHVKVTEFDRKYVYGLLPNYGGLMGGAYTGTLFFKNNWIERVKEVSELKYLDVRTIRRWNLSNLYKYRFEIEFLQRIKSHKMAEEVMYSATDRRGKKMVDMRTVTKKWLRKNKHSLKNRDITFENYELERRIKERGGEVLNGIGRYLRYADISAVPKKISINKFQEWVSINEIDMNKYRKYISILRKIGMKVADKYTILPENLNEAYENAEQLLDFLETERRNREYRKRLKEILRYEKVMGQYAFIVPKQLEEIVFEGEEMGHCVGNKGMNYFEKHTKGQTMIVFIRKIGELDKPFQTMEYRDGRIVQIQQKKAKGTTPEIRKAADAWLEWVHAEVETNVA